MKDLNLGFLVSKAKAEKLSPVLWKPRWWKDLQGMLMGMVSPPLLG